jgi:hypothetical protein
VSIAIVIQAMVDIDETYMNPVNQPTVVKLLRRKKKKRKRRVSSKV